MIIELYGLPGTGKTSFAERLQKSSDFHIVKIKTKRELLIYNLLFLIKYPVKFVVTFFFLVVNSKNLTMFHYKFMNTFLHHNAKHEKARKFKNVIVDQGHFQNIISVFESKLDKSKLTKYIKFLPQPDKLIIFKTDPAIRKFRIDKRGYFTRENMSDERIQEWQENTQSNDALFADVVKNASIHHIFLRADGNVDEVFSKLSKELT